MAKKGKQKKVIRVRPRMKKVGFPTIADLTKSVPKLGLLDPKLREGVTGKIPTAKEVIGR